MKYHFKICYEIDAPLAVSVAVYLDCEHYTHLHGALTNRVEVIGRGPRFYTCHQTWQVLGVPIGQTYTCRYEPPATFINDAPRPFPSWLPNIHHLVAARTTLRYFENAERRTTLSELTVELDLPWWLYPMRRLIAREIERLKVRKDLEDVALIERRARLFGRDSNEAYLRPGQFILYKEDYARYFGPGSVARIDISSLQRRERWPDIRDVARGLGIA